MSEILFTSPEENYRISALESARVYGSYETGERSDLEDHAGRVESLVLAFAGDNLPSEAVFSSYLHDVSDRLINTESTKHNFERANAARMALLEFFSTPSLSNEQAIYTACLLADMVKIELASGEHRKKMASKVQNGNGDQVSEQTIRMITEQYQGDIPASVWGKAEPLLDFDHMRRFVRDVNLESLLIKACELVDNMRHPSSQRESAWLQDVLEAESFYAPICEALGFEGLAAILRSCAHILRLRGQNKEHLVVRARQVHNMVADIGVESVIGGIFGSNKESILSPAVAVDDQVGRPPVYIGEFAVEIESGRLLAGNYRLKTIGSLASKLDKYDGDLPMDTLGMMVISVDEQESARDFVEFISRADALDFRPARSKEKAIYVQGSEEYVALVKEWLDRYNIDGDICEFNSEKQSVADSRGYQQYKVSKVTFITNHEGSEVPTEVQFLSKAERRRSRLGEVAHIVYKYLSQFPNISDDERRRIVESATETLEVLYERKQHLNSQSLGVNERSLLGGDKLLRAIVE